MPYPAHRDIPPLFFPLPSPYSPPLDHHFTGAGHHSREQVKGIEEAHGEKL